MATFLIERNIPGASQLTPEQLRDIARTSNEVVEGLGVAYTWQHSYVAGDKIYCGPNSAATSTTTSAGKPPCRACSRTVSASSVSCTQ